jgi:ABC-type transport system substrate-binding protein
VTDKLFHEEFKITDVAERRKMWNDIQTILMTDLPFIPLVEMPVTNFYRKGFADVITTPYTNSPDVTRAWMRQ